MADLNYFDSFIADFSKKVHDLENDDFILYLTNATPSASADVVKADLAEISTGNGYSGPLALTKSYNAATGTVTLSLTDATITASGGNIGPYRYAVLANDTTTGDRLVGYWDRGSEHTILDGGSVDLDFSGAAITLARAA
jgi:hypothetical protein